MTDTVTLPSRREMRRRLMAVSDASHLADGFYPLLLKHAGTEMVPEGVDLMLALAVHDYGKDLPVPVQATLSLLVPEFRKALR